MPKKIHIYLLITGWLLLTAGSVSAAVKKLSEQAQISILIGDPSVADMFSMFGHAAVRVNDPGLAVDYVFNYGIPNFPAGWTNFIRLFEKNMASELYAIPFPEVEKEYVTKRRTLNELFLHFSQEEKESLWQSLLSIAQSGNRTSYYDIFNHNCTALPLALLEANARGTIRFAKEEANGSYRSFCNQYLAAYPWAEWILNLSMGWAVDRPLSYRESFFLPRQFEAGLLSATVTDSAGHAHPLITEARYLVSPNPTATAPAVSMFTPALCGWTGFVIVILLSVIEWKRKQLMRWMDVVLFTFAGIVGVYLFYIQFIIPQWYSSPNWWILWMHPLHLAGAAGSAAKRFDRWAACYHLFNLCAWSVMLIGLCFAPQYYHPAFAPLMGAMILRSTIRAGRWLRTGKET
jgi:hypothetical protein